MGEVKRFADHASSSKCWTPEQCLESALGELRSGEAATVRGVRGEITQIAVSYYVKMPDGSLRSCYYIAGMNHPEHVAMLALSLQKAIEDWQAP